MLDKNSMIHKIHDIFGNRSQAEIVFPLEDAREILDKLVKVEGNCNKIKKLKFILTRAIDGVFQIQKEIKAVTKPFKKT